MNQAELHPALLARADTHPALLQLMAQIRTAIREERFEGWATEWLGRYRGR